MMRTRLFVSGCLKLCCSIAFIVCCAFIPRTIKSYVKSHLFHQFDEGLCMTLALIAALTGLISCWFDFKAGHLAHNMSADDLNKSILAANLPQYPPPWQSWANRVAMCAAVACAGWGTSMLVECVELIDEGFTVVSALYLTFSILAALIYHITANPTFGSFSVLDIIAQLRLCTGFFTLWCCLHALQLSKDLNSGEISGYNLIPDEQITQALILIRWLIAICAIAGIGETFSALVTFMAIWRRHILKFAIAILVSALMIVLLSTLFFIFFYYQTAEHFFCNYADYYAGYRGPFPSTFCTDVKRLIFVTAIAALIFGDVTCAAELVFGVVTLKFEKLTPIEWKIARAMNLYLSENYRDKID